MSRKRKKKEKRREERKSGYNGYNGYSGYGNVAHRTRQVCLRMLVELEPCGAQAYMVF